MAKVQAQYLLTRWDIGMVKGVHKKMMVGQLEVRKVGLVFSHYRSVRVLNQMEEWLQGYLPGMGFLVGMQNGTALCIQLG